MSIVPRPMLACNDVIEDYDSLRYPLIASPKLDGWRAYNFEGKPHTRSGKLLPNEHTRRLLSRRELDGLDGELICGSPTDPNSMQLAQTAFATIKGEPDFTWYIFDDIRRGDRGFWNNHLMELKHRAARLPSFCSLLPQWLVESAADLSKLADSVLAEGYEGLITRSIMSPYKNGRATAKQQWMLKVKPYVHAEAIVVSLNEKMTNTNEQTTNELGYAKRSTSQDGKVPAGTLGSFTMQFPGSQILFNVGCGKMDDATKQLLWNNRHLYEGKLATIKYFAQTGVVNKPRHGQFVAFRAPEDTAP